MQCSALQYKFRLHRQTTKSVKKGPPLPRHFPSFHFISRPWITGYEILLLGHQLKGRLPHIHNMTCIILPYNDILPSMPDFSQWTSTGYWFWYFLLGSGRRWKCRRGRRWWRTHICFCFSAWTSPFDSDHGSTPLSLVKFTMSSFFFSSFWTIEPRLCAQGIGVSETVGVPDSHLPILTGFNWLAITSKAQVARCRWLGPSSQCRYRPTIPFQGICYATASISSDPGQESRHIFCETIMLIIGGVLCDISVNLDG